MESSGVGVDCHSPDANTSSSPHGSESITANSTDMSSLSGDENQCPLRFRHSLRRYYYSHKYLNIKTFCFSLIYSNSKLLSNFISF